MPTVIGLRPLSRRPNKVPRNDVDACLDVLGRNGLVLVLAGLVLTDDVDGVGIGNADEEVVGPLPMQVVVALELATTPVVTLGIVRTPVSPTTFVVQDTSGNALGVLDAHDVALAPADLVLGHALDDDHGHDVPVLDARDAAAVIPAIAIVVVGKVEGLGIRRLRAVNVLDLEALAGIDTFEVAILAEEAAIEEVVGWSSIAKEANA